MMAQKVFLEELVAAHLFSSFSAFHGAGSFVTAFTT